MTTWLMRGPVSLRSMLIGVPPFDLKSARLYSTSLLRAKARQQFFVRLRAEPRHIGNARPAVLDRRALAIGHMAEIAEEALQCDLLLLGGKNVQRRQIARSEIRRMRHAGRATLFGSPADVPLRGEAVLYGAWLQIVDAGSGKPHEFKRAGGVLAGGERHAGRLAQFAERVHVLGR